jgi:hypothetical protein
MAQYFEAQIQLHGMYDSKILVWLYAWHIPVCDTEFYGLFCTLLCVVHNIWGVVGSVQRSENQ